MQGCNQSDVMVYVVKWYNTDSITDIDGNIYELVQIGDQLWMSENLIVGHYRNGIEIPQVSYSLDWNQLTSGAYSLYNLNPDYS